MARATLLDSIGQYRHAPRTGAHLPQPVIVAQGPSFRGRRRALRRRVVVRARAKAQGPVVAAAARVQAHVARAHHACKKSGEEGREECVFVKGGLLPLTRCASRLRISASLRGMSEAK